MNLESLGQKTSLFFTAFNLNYLSKQKTLKFFCAKPGLTCKNYLVCLGGHFLLSH